MFRWWVGRGVAAVAVTAGIVLSGGAAHADAGERITAYDVNVAVHPDGTAHVRETIRYDFGANARHGIYRKILTAKRVDRDTRQEMDVTNVRAASPDAPATADVSDTGTYTEVKVGDPDRTITGEHTYTLDYDTDHVATKAGGGVRYAWNAVGDEWDVPISDVTVTLAGPATLSGVTCFAGAYGATDRCASAHPIGDRARFAQQRLNSGEELTVQADLPAGSVAVDPKLVRDSPSDDHERSATLLPSIGAGVTTVVLVLLALGAYLYVRRWRDAIAARPPLPGLPEAMTPGLAAYVWNDGERGMVVGTLLDLARRGFLRVDDVPGRKQDWTVTRTAPWDPALAPHEQALLRGLFPGRDQVRISKLKDRFRATVGAMNAAVSDDARRRGWAREPYARWIVYACAAPFALLAFAEITARDTDGWPFLVGGFGLVAVVIVRTLAPMFRFTPAGEDAQRQVRALRDQLADPVRAGAVDAEWALPYAVAFGLAPQWEAAMANGTVRRAAWYTGIGIAAFTTTAGASMISSPSSSGGGSGGGGFSGGGAGGGGGGGGGGSW